ncbi:metal ABC transporter ATP-binding protein [Schaalia sp. lx-100]|uniref:metal ABC transporter ATP-binding protein n=1 Tax=Schaalia sp. lx-100 TaxID=2899081 RepID=UPI001E37AB71|nr:ABC transporter ATP-binding protein [Schaalia sp. lx-100]MCD4557541.1 ABC transporter ATP-binding protein [Schaalia sp. lx-100]
MFACEVKNLSVAYHDRVALHNVSIQVNTGDVMAILGPNGAGKSTLVKAAVGLIPSLTGNVEFFGEPLDKVRHRVAYMPQAAEIDWDFPATVRDIVTMGTYGRLGWLKRPGAREHAAVKESLEAVGISDLADRQISQLSGGQKQRVFVARTLAQRADLCILDEPFAGVDVASEHAITDVLSALQEAGTTVIIVHHDLSTVRRFCTASTLLSSGKLIATGPLEESFTQDKLHIAYGLLDEKMMSAHPTQKATEKTAPHPETEKQEAAPDESAGENK